ncbi:MAG: copper resistance system multicopper oxidase [Gammaproteobacteria bacterium]|nr:copper resistance system multicopper oxidase [Gammaproteobacteria bacterium]
MKNRRHSSISTGVFNTSRRRFVQGLAAGGTLGSLGLLKSSAWALDKSGNSSESHQVLHGTEFDLVIDATPVNFTGETRIATVVNGRLPAPELHWREGDTVTLRVTNKLKHSTSIHWHGIILPNPMDGVPGLTFDGIAPGETFVYRFTVAQSGTYWYHSHSGFQEQTGLYGPLVIDPRHQDPFKYDRDYVLMLSDWTNDSPDFVYSRLKKMDGYYNHAKLTLGDFISEAKQRGLSAAWAERAMWDEMRMNPRDLADVSAATYTYLLNGTTPVGNWTGMFTPGEKLRLRLINGSAMTFFDVRIPGLKMTVVAADGLNVHPVTVDELRIGVAETYDVIVEPHDDRAYTVFAQSADRSGYARGTLAPRVGMHAEVPRLDPVPTLGMADIGMSMGSMPDMDMSGMDHSAPRDEKKSTSDQNKQPGMKCGGGMPGMDNTNTKNMDGMDMSSGSMMKVTQHAATEYGPGTDMRADEVSTRLDDPGVGLRDNGRRVLTYADLKNLSDDWLDPREPSRTLEIHLTGNMERYMWSFNGVKFADAEPIKLTDGERVRIVLVNDTMMEHPIHLHGLWSELESPDGKFQVRKHTITVKPGQRVSYRVLANAKGRWAYHCHLLYHMMAGMFREVQVL